MNRPHRKGIHPSVMECPHDSVPRNINPLLENAASRITRPSPERRRAYSSTALEREDLRES
jgi:hypothetical protein